MSERAYGGKDDEASAGLIQNVDGSLLLTGTTSSYGDLNKNPCLMKISKEGDAVPFE